MITQAAGTVSTLLSHGFLIVIFVVFCWWAAIGTATRPASMATSKRRSAVI